MGSFRKALMIMGITGLSLVACGRSTSGERETNSQAPLIMGGNELVDPAGRTIEERFRAPEGFVRTAEDEGSFGAYLRSLPLKRHGTQVKLYDGRLKGNQGAHEAVVDLGIGRRDLHQCADAVIRLRAEYLYGRGLYGRIHFDLTNGFRVDYSEWMRGKRIAVSGNATWWEQRTGPSNSRDDLWDYLEMVFAYAGTWSLSKELRPVLVDEIRIGDVFIVGGSPGHAVIVVDTAVDGNGGKIFLLAQSYMPAQEIHVLKNPSESSISPWYHVPRDVLWTPEWTFSSSDLKRFSD